MTDDVKRLLHVFQDNLSTLLEASDLDFYNFTDTALIVPEVLDAFIVFDDARDSKIETTENNSLLNILNEGQDVRVNIQSAHISDVPVDESIADAFPRVTKDLVV